MFASRARAQARCNALVCLLATLLAVCPCFSASPAKRSAPGVEGSVLIYPPLDRSRPRPLFIMLHGMCGAPEQTCPHFAATTERLGWLICPRAARACEGGGTTWSYPDREQTVEAAVAQIRAQFPGEVDESTGRTLIGFSLGAFVANDVAQHEGAQPLYPRVLLIGARVFPDVARLKRAGVQRVVLAAGEFDMTYAHMAGQAQRLARAGLPAQFIGLGRVGHRFPDDFAQYFERALDFLVASR